MTKREDKERKKEKEKEKEKKIMHVSAALYHMLCYVYMSLPDCTRVLKYQDSTVYKYLESSIVQYTMYDLSCVTLQFVYRTKIYLLTYCMIVWLQTQDQQNCRFDSLRQDKTRHFSTILYVYLLYSTLLQYDISTQV